MFNRQKAVEPSSNGILKRVALKDLAPDLENALVVGVIIAKQKPRKFKDKYKDGDSFKAVWNFTIRDSLRDYINITYWGCSEDVCAASDKYYTGDVVEIRNPKISVRQFNENGERFRPIVTSPYALTLNDYSEILAYDGSDFIQLKKLLNFPTKPIAGFVPLRDIQNEGNHMIERTVDILGAVGVVGEIRNITTKNGEGTQVRDVVIFDHTSSGLKVTIWESDVLIKANTWKPRSTILFITDARIRWSSFLRAYNATLSNQSVVTENPPGEEAAVLAEYAKTAPLESSAISEQLIRALPDPASITNVMSVNQVCNKINELDNMTSGDDQFTALMYVVPTKLDLDGESPTTRTKCSICKSWIKNNSPCGNADCPSTFENVASDNDISFDIKIDLSDHTGTLLNCRLTGAAAEHVLECTVDQFIKMTFDQKRQLKWKFLLERCAVRIMVLLLNRRTPLISIISCSRVDPLESAHRIPTY